MRNEAALVGLDDDLVLLVQACGAAFGDRVLARVRAAAGASVRFSDGYVFQHLVHGPVSITDLAAELSVTQQAASKQVADLEARGLVERRANPDDGRAKLVELTRRGRDAVEGDRAARRDLQDEITNLLGIRTAAATMAALRQISGHLGPVEQMSNRRLRPESER